MQKGRLEAFSDGVIAIIITIMVLEMKVPHPPATSEGEHHVEVFKDLMPVLPEFLSYVLSFIYVGIYWNNHHHLLHTVRHVTGSMLWANLHLLFWLSLVPFATGWMGENHFAPHPVALYGGILLMAAIAFLILQRTILHAPGGNETLARAVGRDWKGKFSLCLYIPAIGLSFVAPLVSCALFVIVAATWLIPDRRIERTLRDHEHEKKTD